MNENADETKYRQLVLSFLRDGYSQADAELMASFEVDGPDFVPVREDVNAGPAQ